MKQGKYTIADIARIAKVSKTTVSRVLNNKPYVEADTKQRVLAIIDETGFTPQYSAISLAGGKTNIIGLLVPSLSNPYSLTVIQGVAEKIAGENFDLMLYTTGLSEENQKRFIQKLSKKVVDGLVVLLPRESSDLEKELFTSDLPIVLIDHRGINSHVPTIAVTNEKGGYDATNYLVSLGHHAIGFITGVLDFGCSIERLEGYKVALASHNIPFESRYVIPGDFTELSGYSSTKALMSQKKPPTAIFCSNDEMAIGAVKAIQEIGLRVPYDVSIIGFDDISKASMVYPPLTTIRQPLFKMGENAANLLLDLIKGTKIDKTCVVLQTELVIRGSCARREQTQKIGGTQ